MYYVSHNKPTMTTILPMLAWIGIFAVNDFHQRVNNTTENATITQVNGRHQSRSDQNPNADATNPTVGTNQSTPRARTIVSLNPSRFVNTQEVVVNPGDFIRPPTMDITPNRWPNP